MELSYWLFLPQVWLIAGIILILAEVLDGNMIFFLPFGLASLCNSALVSMQGSLSLPGFLVLEEWSDTLIALAIFAVIASLILRLVSRGRARKKDGDINEY